jgi:hypothetical protein
MMHIMRREELGVDREQDVMLQDEVYGDVVARSRRMWKTSEGNC